MSDLLKVFCMYSSASFLYSSVISSFARSDSGATATNDTPNIVSGLVVYAVSVISFSSTLNSISAPTLFPIQFCCIFLVSSGQSKLSSPVKSSSA